MGIDPLKRGSQIKDYVYRNSDKKYFRFRSTKFYGGIATADCVGCNILCAFCWNFRRNQSFKELGEFYSAEDVIKRLLKIAEKKGFSKLRVSGGEPTLGRKHLIKILDKTPEEYLFILETNGILLGENKGYAEELSNYQNLHVRVSLKGVDREEFHSLTKAGVEYRKSQLKALRNLKEAGLSYHASVMTLKRDLQDLRRRLSEIDSRMRLEKEELKLYPPVKKRMKDRGVFNEMDQTL